ncbi:alpha/beta hydrolase, putative [Candida dubliniensis CD36]|uniref:Alpha/beta hydrolase, putative n=1 Tax=Candida dubliniensis (strain CD36 / ATCC MYA-646 / CBS 7987 / NCPF 3949 / NRRL Y-17841) TaxID=573826 RepID=B9WAW2_CANDC|nr:alpha/beta hydrolase, putative [Candida dubliniensis CD36]CAX43532.1 alpha/beta hydrolase, putative [Candida dubliniensis CD36]
MFSRSGVIRVRQLILIRYTHQTSSTNVLTPTFSVDEIRDLPYSDHVDLAWKQLIPYKVKINKQKTPVLFLHGLFGSMSSFNSIGRSLSAVVKHPVYAVDLRNHGDSPRALPHTYTIMARDIHNFIRTRKWDECILIGHSMGAKVAMMVSLLYPSLVSKLVVVDNTPHSRPLNDQFYKDLLGMCEVEVNGQKYKTANKKTVGKLSEIDRFLSQYEKDQRVRRILTSNLMTCLKHFKNRKDIDHEKEVFKIPVMNFYKYDILGTLGGWPQLPEVKKFDKPVFVMYGNNSDFVLRKYHKYFLKYFSNVKFQEFDSGHWVAMDQPERFLKKLARFIDYDEYIRFKPYKVRYVKW